MFKAHKQAHTHAHTNMRSNVAGTPKECANYWRRKLIDKKLFKIIFFMKRYCGINISAVNDQAVYVPHFSRYFSSICIFLPSDSSAFSLSLHSRFQFQTHENGKSMDDPVRERKRSKRIGEKQSEGRNSRNYLLTFNQTSEKIFLLRSRLFISCAGI